MRRWTTASIALVMITTFVSVRGQGLGLAGAGGAAGGAQALEDMIRQRVGTAPSDKIMIFGGPNNQQYLGCLSCSTIDVDSVFNTIGKYGSTISTTSILNKISDYGSSISQYSPCNTIAAHPPAVVDGTGHYYGVLSLNSIAPDRIKDEKLVGWLAAMCRRG